MCVSSHIHTHIKTIVLVSLENNCAHVKHEKRLYEGMSFDVDVKFGMLQVNKLSKRMHLCVGVVSWRLQS